MTKKKITVQVLLAIVCFIFLSSPTFSQNIQYTFPDEAEQHEGTWLQWPHQYEYGVAFRNENDATWVAMTNALQANEKVHIIAYNATEQTRITNLLVAHGVPLTNVNFKIMQTNDVWVRDNGPIFARNSGGNLVVQDYGFNGWGGDYAFAKDNPVPSTIAATTGMTVVNLNSILTIEGGAYEMDGAGTFLATKTSILSQANPVFPAGIKSIRNLGKTQAQVEAVLTQYLGAIKFIWLDGWFSTDDITDAHIDGFAKFAPGNKLVTMSQGDLLYWGASQTDINKLYAATNANNIAYTKVFIPNTLNDVKKTNGTSLGYKGSYLNYYVANNRVLVPNYNDPNDAIANSIIGSLYPGRTIVGIDVRNLYGNGGMIHCVTQQQPMSSNVVADNIAPSNPANLVASNTNATSTILTWTASTDNVGVTAYDVYQGNILKATVTANSCLVSGLTASTLYSFTVKAKDLTGNISGASNVVSLTTLSVVIPPTPISYCASKGYDASGEVIKKVVFGTINNSSTATFGYENFTQLSTNVIKGNSYSITIAPQWFYGTYPEGYAVFIDFNNDGDFTDIGEKVFTKSATTLATITGNITIPYTASIGTTRMRVSMKYNGIPTACETFSYGQVEDYTINIMAGALIKTLPEKVPILENDEIDFALFPNPVIENNLNIKSSTLLENINYSIFSMQGKLISKGETHHNVVDVANLSTGNYFIEIIVDGKRKVKQFVKQ